MAVARELTGADLVVGEAYYILTYADQARVVPLVESVIYLGQDLDGEQDGSRYFQDAVSYLEHGAYPGISKASGEEAGDADIIVTEAEPPPNLFTMQDLIKALAEALPRAAKRPRLEKYVPRNK